MDPKANANVQSFNKTFWIQNNSECLSTKGLNIGKIHKLYQN